MKKRIRSIFLLMIICILGINVFQGYWLYTTYELNVRQFSRTVREALYQTLQKQQMADAQRLFGRKQDQDRVVFRRFEMEEEEPASAAELMDAPQRIHLRESIDSGTTQLRLEDGKSRMMVFSFRQKKPVRDTVTADTLARRISNMLIVNWAGNGRFNLKRIDSLYRQELAAREVSAEFLLDTLTYHPAPGKLTVVRWDETSREGYAVQTPPVPVNPVRGQFIQAFFKTPTSYILRRMGWLLGSSVLLLALTTGCFLFMLSTILRQKKLSEIKNDFINNMTHELKTPIATVSAAVEAMQHFGALNDPQRTQNYLSTSRNELQRLSDLVEKVLNMAVEEQRELVLNPERLYPADLIQELVERHQLKAQKPVSFQVDVPPTDDAVRVDRVHVGNVINNLIDNAIKYSRESVTIRIRSRMEPEGWRLTVEDDGIGIPKGYQDAIFDRFFRVPTGNLHPVKGFGLGLYYVRQVVEKHGGQIHVRSEAGRGSEFEILIPG